MADGNSESPAAFMKKHVMIPELTSDLTFRHSNTASASARIILLAAVSFSMGVAGTILWFHLSPSQDSSAKVFQMADDPSRGQPAPVTPVQAPMVAAQPIDPVVLGQVRQIVPNYSSIPLDKGEDMLRDAALKEFGAAVQTMNDQVAAAQQRLEQAQDGSSSGAQQDALKHLQDMQLAQGEKLKEITLRLQAQIAALNNLKTAQ